MHLVHPYDLHIIDCCSTYALLVSCLSRNVSIGMLRFFLKKPKSDTHPIIPSSVANYDGFKTTQTIRMCSSQGWGGGLVSYCMLFMSL